MKKFLQILGLIALIILSGITVSFRGTPTGAMAPAGLTAVVATSSTRDVGPQNSIYAFGTTTRETAYMCASRLVTTSGSPVNISFAALSSSTLSTTVGYFQGTSTSAVYDSGLFGCGYMTIRGINASTTINITEVK